MDHDKCKIFIELYRRHRSLWDPKHYDYHNSTIRENSWREMSSILNLPVADLKTKMRSLMGTFRRERSRQKKSLTTRSGKGDIYVSRWFAFDCFDFLSDRENANQVMEVLTKTEADVSMDEQNGMDIAHAEVLMETVDEMHAGTSYNSPQRNCSDPLELPATSPKKKRRMTSPSEEGHTLEKLFTMLQERMDVINTDPYFTFGQHIANELRKYDARTLTQVKHAINNIIFDADMRRIQQQLSTEGDAPQASGMCTSGLVDPAFVPDYTNTTLRGTRKSRK